MILISHRGNVAGSRPERENHPDYIFDACIAGYNVEIDVWFIDNQWFLGHDGPQYRIDEEFLLNPKFWCHAKNIEALQAMRNIGAHCFWHQNDDVVLTSKGFLWTFPGKKLYNLSICVLPEAANYTLEELSVGGGICSDFIDRYKKNE